MKKHKTDAINGLLANKAAMRRIRDFIQSKDFELFQDAVDSMSPAADPSKGDTSNFLVAMSIKEGFALRLEKEQEIVSFIENALKSKSEIPANEPIQHPDLAN